MQTDDEQVICQLVDERYSTMRKVRQLRRDANAMLAMAKRLEKEVRHITLKKIAGKFDVTAQYVWVLAKTNGVDVSGVNVPRDKTRVVEMRNQGMTFREIGKSIGVTYQRAQQMYQEACYPDF